jgi:hypothetical protein
MAARLADADVEGELSPAAIKALDDLNLVCEKERLPDDLELAVTGR